MTDLEWARAFVGCKIEGTGFRFNETVDVLVKKLAQVREEASGHMRRQEQQASAGWSGARRKSKWRNDSESHPESETSSAKADSLIAESSQRPRS